MAAKCSWLFGAGRVIVIDHLEYRLEFVRNNIVGVYGPTDDLIPVGNILNKGLTVRANQASVRRLLPRLIRVMSLPTP